MAFNKEEFLEKIKDKYRKFCLFFSILSILTMLAYPIYSLIAQHGNFYVNIAVLVVTLIYGAVWLILGSNRKYRLKRIYKWIRLTLTFVSICINAYSIYVTATNFNFLAVLMSILLTTFWIINVIFNVLYEIASRKFEKFIKEKKQEFTEYKAQHTNKKYISGSED